MAQFAHGIRSLDVSVLDTNSRLGGGDGASRSVTATPMEALNHSEEDEFLTNREEKMIWLVGTCHTESSSFLTHFESLPFMTYRNNFEAIAPYDYTSDAGWGCMLRSGQMLLCQALNQHILGRSWRLTLGEELSPAYIQIQKWFVDHPDVQCIYSIHQMVKLGMQYDKLPGEWYGPTTATQVMRDLVNLHSKELGGLLSMYVAQDGVVYTEDVEQLCTEVTPKDGKDANAPFLDRHENGTLVDPLLNPPLAPPASDWTTGLLVLIPLRLESLMVGLDKLNETYVAALTKTFEFPQSVGIIGGKRAHSVYFVGVHGMNYHYEPSFYQSMVPLDGPPSHEVTNERNFVFVAFGFIERDLILLDPHTVQPTTQINASFPSATHLRSLRSSCPLKIDIENIDPSLAFGFYCQDRADYQDFCNRVSLINQTTTCPFSIAATRPDYGNDLDMSMNDSIHFSDHSDIEDEFVVV